MTITLPLEPKEEALLLAAAEAKGISTAELVREALHTILAEPQMPQRDKRSIWEVLSENMQGMPIEELEKLPTDGASEHDHYLYGAPKRNA